MAATTPSRSALRAGLVVEVEAGDSVTLHPSPTTRTIVVTVEEKTGRRARLRVQAREEVEVSGAALPVHAAVFHG